MMVILFGLIVWRQCADLTSFRQLTWVLYWFNCSKPALFLYNTVLCHSFKSYLLILNLFVNLYSGSTHLFIDLSCSLNLTFHFKQIIPLSTVMCDVWLCDEHPWSACERDFVTNMLPHTSIWLHTAASKRSGSRLEFHIYPFCLDFSPEAVCLCLNIFEQDCLCVCASVCVSQLIVNWYQSVCGVWTA